MSLKIAFNGFEKYKTINKEQQEHEGLGLRGAFGGGMGPVQFNDEYEDINAYRER